MNVQKNKNYENNDNSDEIDKNSENDLKKYRKEIVNIMATIR